jgi:flagellar biosynthesis/type III secretory pathway protein FliH
MSVAEMKIEVINKITNVNDEAILQNVLSLLKEATKSETINLSKNYDAIKDQYGDVLQKLAE